MNGNEESVDTIAIESFVSKIRKGCTKDNIQDLLQEPSPHDLLAKAEIYVTFCSFKKVIKFMNVSLANKIMFCYGLISFTSHGYLDNDQALNSAITF